MRIDVYCPTKFNSRCGANADRAPTTVSRRWIARRNNRVIAAVAVACSRPHVATVYFHFQGDPSSDWGVGQDLLVAAFQYCRQQGVLKIKMDDRWESTVRDAANAARIIPSSTTAANRHRMIELYVNIYRDGRDRTDTSDGSRATYADRVGLTRDLAAGLMPRALS